MKQVLTGMIKAHEIRAASRWKTPLTASASTTFCYESGFHRRGRRNARPDPRGNFNAVSLAWVDGQSLRTYRHARTPARVNPGRRAMPLPARYVGTDGENGRNGLPVSPDCAGRGFYDVSFKGESFRFQRPYGLTSWKMCCSKSPSRRSSTPSGS